MKCPGQETQYWTEGAIYDAKCPKCGTIVEFFKDDTARKCGSCGHRFANPRLDFGCASYCKYAEQCLGTLPPELLAERGDLLKDRVAIEMKRYFKSDFKRIGHATRVARYAERIGKEEGGNLSVIISAAFLHDIGIHDAEKKYNSTAARYQEELGPAIADGILKKLGAAPAMIEEVCDMVGHHHHPREEETVNFKALYDADLIANLEDNKADEPITEERLNRIIEKSFLTPSGGDLARKTLL
ncbi:MAG: HD domain-containing protein [Proteobacteria bacterium]|nr:HD domain-containing protein [Pseudomonadota bacterium]